MRALEQRSHKLFHGCDRTSHAVIVDCVSITNCTKHQKHWLKSLSPFTREKHCNDHMSMRRARLKGLNDLNLNLCNGLFWLQLKFCRRAISAKHLLGITRRAFQMGLKGRAHFFDRRHRDHSKYKRFILLRQVICITWPLSKGVLLFPSPDQIVRLPTAIVH